MKENVKHDKHYNNHRLANNELAVKMRSCEPTNSILIDNRMRFPKWAEKTGINNTTFSDARNVFGIMLIKE